MSRVIVNKDGVDLSNVVALCPVAAIKSADGKFGIDQNNCIDCGVCQGQAPEGSIVKSKKASEEDVKLNEEVAKKGK
jgi:Fe-S-cluster-containing hydrogenase component 2